MARYDLDALGWYQFESLCQSLLKSEFGVGIEAWGGQGDLGRDAYSLGPHGFPDRSILSSGPFLFQAKFVAGANAAGSQPYPALKKAVDSECSRIRTRVQQGKWKDPNHYILLTNAPVSADERTQLESTIQKTVPSAAVSVQGASDLDALLDSNEAVRVAFPQILGVRNLRDLIENVVYKQHKNLSNITLNRYAESAAIFVPTRAYSLALDRLNRHGLAVLVGPPEVGKTTIAHMIALARHATGWDAFECRGPSDFYSSFEGARRQVFVADDAFGSTEYRPDTSVEWARELPNIIHTLRQGRHNVIFTTRTGPLTAALQSQYFQDEAREFPDPGRISVDVGGMTRVEKTLMLYRHCRHVELTDSMRSLVKQEWPRIVDSRHFTPLRISRLVRDDLPKLAELEAPKRAAAIRSVMEESLTQPSAAYQTSFAALPAELKQVLISMVDAGAGTVDVEDLQMSVDRHVGPDRPMDINSAIELLNEHFLELR